MAKFSSGNRKGSIIEQLSRDKHGRVVLWQAPNIPIIVWFVCLVVMWLAPAGNLKLTFSIFSTVALAIWAVLEVVQGASYFRRLLGVMVMLSIAANLLYLLL